MRAFRVVVVGVAISAFAPGRQARATDAAHSPTAPDACAAARANLDAADAALRDCLAAGGGCAKQFAAKNDAEKAAAPCPAPTAAPQTAATPAADTATPAATATPAQSTAMPLQALHLVDGSVLRGRMVGSHDDVITFDTAAGVLSIPQSKISRIDMDASSATAEPASPAAPVATPATYAVVPPADGGRIPMFLQLDVWGGDKELAAADWRPVDSFVQAGARMSIAGRHWTVGSTGSLAIAIDLYLARSTGSIVDDTSGDLIDYAASTTEVGNGIRWIIHDASIFRPYIGAGLSEGFASFSVDDRDTGESNTLAGNGIGVWFEAGAFLRFGRGFDVGGEWRYANVPATLGSVTTNMGGSQFGVTLGYSFGSAATRDD